MTGPFAAINLDGNIPQSDRGVRHPADGLVSVDEFTQVFANIMTGGNAFEYESVVKGDKAYNQHIDAVLELINGVEVFKTLQNKDGRALDADNSGAVSADEFMTFYDCGCAIPELVVSNNTNAIYEALTKPIRGETAVSVTNDVWDKALGASVVNE